MKKFKQGIYKIGTKANTKAGDLSRPAGDLCIVFKDTGKNYIGNWVIGLGFVNVKFPKKTTRSLSMEEKAYWNGRKVGIDDSWYYTIKI